MSLDWLLLIALYRAAGNCTPAEILLGIDVQGVKMELMPQDKLTCLQQSLDIRTTAFSEIMACFWIPLSIPGCSDDAGCTRRRIEALKRVEGQRHRVFPMRCWPAKSWDLLGLCTSCVSVMKTAHGQALESFWAKLPQRFGLPGWDVLKQMKQRDLA